MSIRTILIASILASLGATLGQERAAVAQPVLPPPPAPMYQPQPEPEPAYPPAPSYTPQQQPAPTQPQPAQQQPQGYPPPAPPQQPQGYPSPGQPAQPGYPQQQPEPAYPQQPATGYPQPGPGYPPPGQPQQPQGYPQQQPQGYPAQPQGYPPPPPQGQPAQPQGYPAQPPPGQPAQPQGQPAQTQGYPPQQQGYPAPQQDYPAPPPPAPEPEPATESVFANPLSKLQVGFHLGMGSLTADNRTYDSDLTSLGIFARYRFNERWEAELGIAQDSGTVSANGATREFQPITASALWHVFNVFEVDVYARLGLGRATESYRNPAFSPLEGPTTHLHVGAGATYIFRGNIGAGVEMRWQSIRRGATDSISALNASGTSYSLVGSYHF